MKIKTWSFQKKNLIISFVEFFFLHKVKNWKKKYSYIEIQ